MQHWFSRRNQSSSVLQRDHLERIKRCWSGQSHCYEPGRLGNRDAQRQAWANTCWIKNYFIFVELFDTESSMHEFDFPKCVLLFCKLPKNEYAAMVFSFLSIMFSIFMIVAALLLFLWKCSSSQTLSFIEFNLYLFWWCIRTKRNFNSIIILFQFLETEKFIRFDALK